MAAQPSQLSTNIPIFVIAGVFAMLGLVFALYNIMGHITHYRSPKFQRPIVRILFIIPIYAAVSWASLRADEVVRVYLEIARDWYEAFVIYCFLTWILVAIGGETTCGNAISRRMYMSHPWPLCCLPQLRLNVQFLKSCKALTLQFVILKPIMAGVSFTLLACGHGTTNLYMNPAWQEIRLVLYNTSYTLALYGLFLFYLATKEEMKAYSPIKKFIGVKTIVFATYWQQLIIPWIFGYQHADQINDFILCIEMLFFSFLHYRAFPWWEFKDGRLSPSSSRTTFLEELDVRLSPRSEEAMKNRRENGIQFASMDESSKRLEDETTNNGEGGVAVLNVASNLLHVLNPTDVVIDTGDTFGITGKKNNDHASNMRYTAMTDDEEPPARAAASPRSMGLRFDSKIRVQPETNGADDTA